MKNQPSCSTPTAFDLVRYGYFGVAFGDLLKAIRGGTTPIGIMTLAMCSISVLSEIGWSIQNQTELLATGELPNKKRLTELGYYKNLFEDWLQRWICDSKINPNCKPAKAYGVRCALVHTSGASEILSKTGVKAWRITTKEPLNHYNEVIQMPGNEPQFSLEMPDFLAELILAADQFATHSRAALEASDPLQKRIGFLALPIGTDFVQRIDNNTSLAWFDSRLSCSPLNISKDVLSEKIRAFYYKAVNAGLVLQ